jgi:8-oxo-dGTP diphosphatase
METIKAVVGLIKSSDDRFLISKRRQGKFMSGYWELPGGKINTSETAENAIKRELKEELGIKVIVLHFVRSITHKYPDRNVDLSYFLIDSFEGSPFGAENQHIDWASITSLGAYRLLPSVKEVIYSLTLPSMYWITPSIGHYSDEWVNEFDNKLAQGIKLIQLRAKNMLDERFIKSLYIKCNNNNARLLLNTINKTYEENYADGWHITTQEMLSMGTRPCGSEKIIGASTHNLTEALKAVELNIDFIVISPVQATKTHPEAHPLGWQAAKDVVDKVNTPVYFLGGMGVKDLEKTIKFGAQGIAGVSAF